VHRAYYEPLNAFLERRGPRPFRIEIPFTQNHWEARWVAPTRPLARVGRRLGDLIAGAPSKPGSGDE
jgi:hypothetical protein